TKTITTKVNPGAITHFGITAPSSATTGTPFNITVIAQDAFNNRVNGYRGTIHFTSSDGSATLPGDYTFNNADQGQHAFSVTLRTHGGQTVRVTDTGNSGLTGTATVQVNDLAPTNLMATGGSGTIALSWTGLTGATSYNVYRSASAGTETLLTAGVTTTSYT